jgi:hypothetical protein
MNPTHLLIVFIEGSFGVPGVQVIGLVDEIGKSSNCLILVSIYRFLSYLLEKCVTVNRVSGSLTVGCVLETFSFVSRYSASNAIARLRHCVPISVRDIISLGRSKANWCTLAKQRSLKSWEGCLLGVHLIGPQMSEGDVPRFGWHPDIRASLFKTCAILC